MYVIAVNVCGSIYQWGLYFDKIIFLQKGLSG